MCKKRYRLMAVINLLLGIFSSFLYLPYFFEAFNMNCKGWINACEKLFKSNYTDVLMYFGIAILVWIVLVNVVSFFFQPNLAKLSFKATTFVSLALPILYVCALNFNPALKFWANVIAPHLKLTAYVCVASSVGFFILGFLLNIVKENKSNFHNVFQALATVMVNLTLILTNDWCGWRIWNVNKWFGLLMISMPIYYLISPWLLLKLSKIRQ